jgi:hydrogenase/urease accessory protein HupE
MLLPVTKPPHPEVRAVGAPRRTHCRRCKIVLLVAAALCALALSWRASAHQINLSTARIEQLPDRLVRLEIALKGSDVDRVAGTHVFDAAADLVDPARLAASATPIATYLLAHAVVAGEGGAPCTASEVALAPDRDGVAARFEWSCAATKGDLVYRSTVLLDKEPAAKQVVLIGAGPDAAQALLDAAETELRLTAPAPSLAEIVRRYIEAGIEHIFLGYDHIAFLVAVVLWGRRLWPVIKIVTAFTIAHSITLSLAALDVVVVPSTIVEPAIAASIVFVAVENFFSRDIDRRWRYAFAFGLIHGFGFASALQEFGLPRGSVVPALAAFNAGVEAGQVAIVSLVMPVLIAFDRILAVPRRAVPMRAPQLVYALSTVIATLGCYWVIERTLLA